MPNTKMSGYQGSYNHYGGAGGASAAPNSYSKVNSFGANPVRAKLSGAGPQGLGGVGAHIMGPAHLPKLGERGASRSKMPNDYGAMGGGGYGGYGGGGSGVNSGGGNYGSLGNYGGGGGRIAPRLSGLNHGGIGGAGAGSYQSGGGFGGGGFGSMSGNNGGGNEFSYGRY